MNWVNKIDQVLTPRRMTYAWIAGIALWSAWLISVLFGPGNMDLAGQVIGTDYLQFFTAGETIRQGQSANLYNFAFQSQLEQTIAGPGLINFHAFITPPFLAWLYVPFTVLPYSWSFLVWSVLGFLLLWGSIKLIPSDQPNKSFLWALTWFPIFAAVSFGQNSLLSLFLFSFTFWLWKKEKYLSAGLASSLLLYKPQMVLGLGILWLLDYRQSWKSLLGLVGGGAILASLSFWFLPDASRAYLNLVRTVLPDLIYQKEFPIWHLHSLRGFWILLLPGQRFLAEGLSFVLSAIGVIGYFLFWRKNQTNKRLLFAAAICLTIWISPHAMIYDWSILIIPAVIFWQSFPLLKPLFKVLYALIWIATFISTPLTVAQLKFLPIALQISLPILGISLILAIRSINKGQTTTSIGQA
jgi:alpha-1,2-mannosyltransferase